MSCELWKHEKKNTDCDEVEKKVFGILTRAMMKFQLDIIVHVYNNV